MAKRIQIIARETKEVLAEGPVGLTGIASLEGNYYIPKKHLKTNGFKTNFVPGLCFYKFIYLWLNLKLNNGKLIKFAGWRYVIPNPLFWFVAWRIGVPARHPDLVVREI